MILSRIWYIVLSLLLGMAAYIVFLAVGQYNRRNGVAMTEELASDSQTVGWALQIDARKRLDALLIGAVDKGVEDSLQGANGRDTIPSKARDDGRRALVSVLDKIPADFKPDALFAVDHDGRVVAEVGYDVANALPDFELGGYPAVFDAIHGFLRDDSWVLGGKLYRVAARPVEFDATQPPLGAIVALRLVDKRFAQDLSKRTRASVAFYAQGQRVASSAAEGFDEGQLDLIDVDLPKLAGDKEYVEGRSEVRFVSDKVGVMYARMFGDAWELGAGFAVARARVTIDQWQGFLSGADDKDKQSVDLRLLAGLVFLGIFVGLGFSFLEHSRPVAEMRRQSMRLRKGEIDYFQLPRFRGAYRAIAQDVNAGIERVLEKGGAAVRKPADLESILGPVPAQPSMSAFSFPLPTDAPAPAPPPRVPPGGPLPPEGADSPPIGAAALAATGAAAIARNPPPARPPVPGAPHAAPPPRPASAPHLGPTGPGFPPALGHAHPPANAPVRAAPPPAAPPAQAPAGPSLDDGPTVAVPQGFSLPDFGTPPKAGSSPGPRRGATMLGTGGEPPLGTPPPMGGEPTLASAIAAPVRPAAGAPAAVIPPPPPSAGSMSRQLQDLHDSEDEATVVARAPSELLEQSGANRAAAKPTNDVAEWMTVYDDFVRTKKQCGEPTEGLTFEKFQATLKKNRDALVQRHNCKRVRFSVYVKEGRASLKATPVRD